MQAAGLGDGRERTEASIGAAAAADAQEQVPGTRRGSSGQQLAGTGARSRPGIDPLRIHQVETTGRRCLDNSAVTIAAEQIARLDPLSIRAGGQPSHQMATDCTSQRLECSFAAVGDGA